MWEKIRISQVAWDLTGEGQIIYLLYRLCKTMNIRGKELLYESLDYFIINHFWIGTKKSSIKLI